MVCRETGSRRWEQSDWRQWVMVAQSRQEESWKMPATITLHVPIPFRAGERRCLYVHASSPHGRGLLVQRCAHCRCTSAPEPRT
eukprot:64541-Prymnesium_polylepis.1